MKQRPFLTALVCLALAAAPGLALAGKPKVHPAGGGPTPVSLQEILNSLVVSGPTLDANSPANIDSWNASTGPMTAQIVVNQTSKSEKVRFGLFDSGNPSTLGFLLSDTGGSPFRSSDVAAVSFNENGSIGIHGGTHGPVKGSKNGFDGPFGFFVRDQAPHSSPVFLFTESFLNPSGATAVKVFQGNDRTMLKLPGKRGGLFLDSQFLVAFETGSDHGFDDIVFLVSGILPGPHIVPEPETLALLAISTLGVLFARRGRNS